ncbi:tetratricopeptide repeat protein [Polycladidibacter hongkongensis]|uniref:tetratricopeptide repeat protein n=1 Tax=Polycladidibacter hongkongensis TaxID=1647556 RepID=UPI0008336A36|nr:tetratricopeptide repeat protein [Pseudovibrio hongkongensis]
MSDIFREVDEDVRNEQFSRLWKRLSPIIYTTAALIVVGTAGYKGYSSYAKSQAASSGQVFLEAVKASDAGQHDEAIAKLETLEDAAGGYPMLSKFRIAGELAAKGDKAKAVELLDALAGESGNAPFYRALASVRAAYILLDSETPIQLQDRLSAQLQPGATMYFPALEVMAVAHYKAGDFTSAAKYLTDIEEDATAPSDVASRARIYLDLIGSSKEPAT